MMGMIDLSDAYGVLLKKDGVILVMNGKFFGPLNMKQLDRVLELMENVGSK